MDDDTLVKLLFSESYLQIIGYSVNSQIRESIIRIARVMENHPRVKGIIKVNYE